MTGGTERNEGPGAGRGSRRRDRCSRKIDKAFVDGLATDDDDRAIAEAVVTLAHRLRLTVTAEGVQTAEQLAVLRDLGCDQWQGCLFGPPDTAEVASRLL